MTFRTVLTAFLVLFISPPASAGAWDVGPFENDEALDFVYDLTEYKSYRLLWGGMDSCMPGNRGGYLEAPDGSRAVAAAALVAANLTGDVSSVPEELHDWVSAKSWAEDVKLVGTAKMCLDLVTDAETSELAELWADAGLYDEWVATIDEISSKLQ